jgi:hypothetical protein
VTGMGPVGHFLYEYRVTITVLIMLTFQIIGLVLMRRIDRRGRSAMRRLTALHEARSEELDSLERRLERMRTEKRRPE